jgi:hypothetical protein
VLPNDDNGIEDSTQDDIKDDSIKDDSGKQTYQCIPYYLSLEAKSHKDINGIDRINFSKYRETDQFFLNYSNRIVSDLDKNKLFESYYNSLSEYITSIDEIKYLTSKCHPFFYPNLLYLSSDTLALYVLSNDYPTNPELLPFAPYQEGKTSLSDQIQVYQNLIFLKTDDQIDIDIDLLAESRSLIAEKCQEYRALGMFCVNIDNSNIKTDIDYYDEIATLYNIKQVSFFPFDTCLIVYQVEKNQGLVDDWEQWMAESVLYCKNDGYPQIRIPVISGSLTFSTPVNDAILTFVTLKALIRTLLDNSQTRRYPMTDLIRYFHVQNGYLTISSPSIKYYHKLTGYLYEILNDESIIDNLVLYNISNMSSDETLYLRFELSKLYERLGENLYIHTQGKLKMLVMQVLPEYRQAVQDVLDQLNLEYNNDVKKQLLEYYQDLCKEDQDPISQVSFDEMSITELSNLIAGYDVRNMGKPYCFQKDTLLRLNPPEINPITQVPFLESTMIHLSLQDLAINGLFDIGPFKGMLSTDYYSSGDINNGNINEDTGKLINVIPGTISYENLGNDEYLYTIEFPDGRDFDLFVTSVEPSDDILNKLNNAWNTGGLSSPWFNIYHQKTNRYSCHLITTPMRQLLASTSINKLL